MSFEKFPGPEQESMETRLTRLLKEKGVEDPEVMRLLDSWTQSQEQEVENSEDPAAPIEFNLRRARLYWSAGCIDEAFENFEAARTQAWNTKRNDLYNAIMAEMDNLENELEGEELE